jgi:hypothetical protein
MVLYPNSKNIIQQNNRCEPKGLICAQNLGGSQWQHNVIGLLLLTWRLENGLQPSQKMGFQCGTLILLWRKPSVPFLFNKNEFVSDRGMEWHLWGVAESYSLTVNICLIKDLLLIPLRSHRIARTYCQCHFLT